MKCKESGERGSSFLACHYNCLPTLNGPSVLLDTGQLTQLLGYAVQRVSGRVNQRHKLPRPHSMYIAEDHHDRSWGWFIFYPANYTCYTGYCVFSWTSLSVLHRHQNTAATNAKARWLGKDTLFVSCHLQDHLCTSHKPSTGSPERKYNSLSPARARKKNKGRQ